MSKRPSRGVTSGVGTPTKMTGRDGDLTIRKTREGKILYVKEHGSWHPINTGVDTVQLKKNVDKLIRSVNTIRNDNSPFLTIDTLNVRRDTIKLGTSGTGLQIKNNSADFEIVFDDNNKKIIGGSSSKVVRDVNDGNPSWQIGSSDTENFKIQTTYASGAKGLDKVSINTNTASSLINHGQISLNVDGEDKLILNDSAHEILVDGVTASDVDANSQPVGIHIKNKASHASNTNTRSSIRFSQKMSNTVSETFDEVASIVSGSEGTYNSLASTADGYLSLQTALNGTLTERLKIASNGDVTINDKIITSGSFTLDSGSNIELNADGGLVNFKDDSVSMAQISSGKIELYPTDADDYMRLAASTNGATTLFTNDDSGGNNADFTLNIAGDICLDSANGNFIAKYNGTEFSAANSAYAGMILGYTCLRGDGTNISSFEIQNSLTVEDATHKVSFKTPPSEKVEIEAIFLVNASSTDTRIAVGLSDSDTYNSVGQIHEYDGNAVWFTDDEVDDSLITVKFVLTSTELASIGSDNTFWIGISTDGVTKTAYLTYGLRSSHGVGEHPFVIKATALPATIYDGT